MKAFSLLVALMALSSLGGNGNGFMSLHEKAKSATRPLNSIFFFISYNLLFFKM